MLSIIGFVVVIGLLVFVHEFGHYYVARVSGVRVLEFSIGFGKEIWSKVDSSGVRWRIAAIPLGGFVKMLGDKDPASTGYEEVEDRDRAFYAKPAWVRFLIVLAGPLANYLFAIVILALLNVAYGRVIIPAIIDEVIPESPAAVAGIKSDDVIARINGTEVHDFSDVQQIVALSAGRQIDMLIRRAGGELELKIKIAERVEKDGGKPKFKTGYLGVRPKNTPEHINFGLIDSCFKAVGEVVDISILIFKSIKQMIVGERSSSELYGPFTIAEESGKSLAGGPFEFLLFIVMMSINLGLINLLPIPVLDGGALVVICYEMLTGKVLSKHIQNFLIRAGALIIVFLIVISISNDIRSLLF